MADSWVTFGGFDKRQLSACRSDSLCTRTFEGARLVGSSERDSKILNLNYKDNLYSIGLAKIHNIELRGSNPIAATFCILLLTKVR